MRIVNTLAIGLLAALYIVPQAPAQGCYYGYSYYSYPYYGYSYYPYSYYPSYYYPSYYYGSMYYPPAYSAYAWPQYYAAPAYAYVPQDPPRTRTSSYSPAAAPRTAATTSGPAVSVTVETHDNYFEPATLTIQPGTTVRFQNTGKRKHTVTSQGKVWDSGELSPGGSFSLTFHRPGTYVYQCRLQSKDRMMGMIVVGEGDSSDADDADDVVVRSRKSARR
jgi:plastocyanin